MSEQNEIEQVREQLKDAQNRFDEAYEQMNKLQSKLNKLERGEET